MQHEGRGSQQPGPASSGSSRRGTHTPALWSLALSLSTDWDHTTAVGNPKLSGPEEVAQSKSGPSTGHVTPRAATCMAQAPWPPFHYCQCKHPGKLNAPVLAAKALGFRPDPSFLWLPCIFSLYPLTPLSCSLTCLPTMPLFVLGTWSQLSPAFSLSPWPSGVCGSAQAKVKFPSLRDRYTRSTSKHLTPFTDGINGIICHILKVVSKCPLFREANKETENGPSSRIPA
jgi:hypothetical protein